MTFTRACEKTAINCLTAHDWNLDVAVDNYFQSPDRYRREQKVVLDRRKIEQLFVKYKGEICLVSVQQAWWVLASETLLLGFSVVIHGVFFALSSYVTHWSKCYLSSWISFECMGVAVKMIFTHEIQQIEVNE